MNRHFQSPWYCRIGLGTILIRVSYIVVTEANTAPGYVGCFFDEFGENSHLLPDHPYDTTGQPRLVEYGMTIIKCIDTCRQLGDTIRYAGLSRRECYCGTAIRKQRFQLYSEEDSACNIPCSGDALDVCGGQSRLSIYDITLGKCNDPGVPNNGHIINPVNPNGTFAFADVITFGCNDAFALEGYHSIKCVLGTSSEESAWNGSIPTCGVVSTPTIISPPQSTPEFQTGNTVGIAAGASVGAVLFLVLIVVLLLYLYKIRKSDPSEETDLDGYEIPPALSDQTPNNQNVSIPADMTDNETYTGLDGSTRQPETVYQGLGVTNRDPDRLKTAGNYKSLDATSRLSAVDYQGIYHNVKMEEHIEQDVIYPECMDPVAASAQSQSTVPIPPRVTGIDNLNGLYVNMKE